MSLEEQILRQELRIRKLEEQIKKQEINFAKLLVFLNHKATSFTINGDLKIKKGQYYNH